MREHDSTKVSYGIRNMVEGKKKTEFSTQPEKGYNFPSKRLLCQALLNFTHFKRECGFACKQRD